LDSSIFSAAKKEVAMDTDDEDVDVDAYLDSCLEHEGMARRTVIV
jgi:hypothetical protein